MAKRSADENLKTVVSSPTLFSLACKGVRGIAADPMVKTVTSLYEQVASYPSGYLWISAYDEHHRDDFTLPDYDLSGRRDQRRLLRVFDRYLLKRKQLLESLLAKLQRGESLPEQQEGE